MKSTTTTHNDDDDDSGVTINMCQCIIMTTNDYYDVVTTALAATATITITTFH